LDENCPHLSHSDLLCREEFSSRLRNWLYDRSWSLDKSPLLRDRPLVRIQLGALASLRELRWGPGAGRLGSTDTRATATSTSRTEEQGSPQVWLRLVYWRQRLGIVAPPLPLPREEESTTVPSTAARVGGRVDDPRCRSRRDRPECPRRPGTRWIAKTRAASGDRRAGHSRFGNPCGLGLPHALYPPASSSFPDLDPQL
jgi:hypothetical protein